VRLQPVSQIVPSTPSYLVYAAKYRPAVPSIEEIACMLQGPDWERDEPRLLLDEKPQ
jgi:hypothetical protein